MTGFHHSNHSSSTSPPPAGSSQLPQPHLATTSPYNQYQGPAAYAAQEGLSSSQTQHGNGVRQGQRPSSYTPAPNSLSATSQPARHPGSQPTPQHHGNVSPALQYTSSTSVNHGASGSPPGQASTPSDQVSSPNNATSGAKGKKNTRIPRACDLCSQRKVKVSHQSLILSYHQPPPQTATVTVQ